MVEIYFKDLNRKKQEELLRIANIDKPEDANWDVIPLAIIGVGD